MLVCENLKDDGWCGKCAYCMDSQLISSNTFTSRISITNMATVDKDRTLELIRESVNLLHEGNKIYIFDEFHTLIPSSQEMWLSESTGLVDTYLILTTSKLSKIDRGIQSRAVKMKMHPLALFEIPGLLRLHSIFDLNDDVIKALHISSGGIPRNILLMAKFLVNSGFNSDEQLEYITCSKKINVELLLGLVVNRIAYFREVHNICSSVGKDELVKAVKECVWSLIINNYAEESIKLSNEVRIKTENLVNFLHEIKNDCEVAFINLYMRMNFKKTGADESAIKTNARRVSDTEKPKAGEPLTRW
jgi:hypothetical protein